MNNQKAFTLVEIVLVIVLLGVMAAIVLRPQFGTFTYWEQEGEIKKLSELITFLYYQAMTDGENYRLEFALDEEPQSYRVGQVVPEELNYDHLEGTFESSSTLIAQEIDNFLHPPPALYSSMVPPEDIPSLAKPFVFPSSVRIADIRTVRGDYEDSSPEDRPYILFSPRGYVEFGVIHLKLERDQEADVTILINPFTGLTDIYREYKEFEWTYGRK